MDDIASVLSDEPLSPSSRQRWSQSVWTTEKCAPLDV